MRSSTGPMAESSKSAEDVETKTVSTKRTERQRYYDQKREAILADPDLGKLSDDELSDRYGVSGGFVRKIRRLVGTESTIKRLITWTPDIDALLGVITDAEIGRMFNIPKQSVWGRRTRKGIPPVVPPGQQARQTQISVDVYPLHYPRSEGLRNEIKQIKQDRIAERLACGWLDYAAYGRLLSNRHHLWAISLRRAALDRDVVYLPRLSWSMVVRIQSMGDDH